MKRAILNVGALLMLALAGSACMPQQGVDGGFPGVGLSVKEVEGYPVTCFIAMSAGDVKSIDCLPNADIQR